VDAAKEDGSLGRLISDEHVNPNSKMKTIKIDGKPHLCLFALKDISPGEEITYNYGDFNWPWRCKKEQHQGLDSVAAGDGTKKVATLSQVLNLKNHELDQVADFLGHDIRVHREYYRLQEATTQLAIISKLLLAMEKGSLTNLQGKDFEIEDTMHLTDSGQSEDSEDEEGGSPYISSDKNCKCTEAYRH
ncbi:hypothetical protein L3Q82_019106, partial [Scortum barcoo]